MFIAHFIPVLSGCAVIKIQQNLPGSLWGNWSVERIGFEVNTNIKDYPYQRACFNKDDIIHFSSDKKSPLNGTMPNVFFDTTS